MTRTLKERHRILLSALVRGEVSSRAADGHPDEVCGLLVGKRDGILRSWQLQRGVFEEQIIEERETWAKL